MRYEFYNPNPVGRSVGDCSVRAVAKALDLDWEQAYVLLASNGFAMGDMPAAESVWGATLRQNGFYKKLCPDCETIEAFVDHNSDGIYVFGCSGHVVTVIDGVLYDTWDSRKEIPQFYWYRR